MRTYITKCVVVLAVAAATIGATGPVVAGQSRIVWGGSVQSSYVYAGDQEDNIFAEGTDVPHDARFEMGGLLGTSHRSGSQQFTLALFAGAIMAVRFEEYRHALARVASAYALHVSPRLDLDARINGELSPVSAIQANATAGVSTVGRLALQLRPEVESRLALDRSHQLVGAVRFNVYGLLASGLEDEEVSHALGIQGDGAWHVQLTPVHGMSAHILARLMRSEVTGLDTPATTLLGAMVGHSLSWNERFELTTRVGLGHVLNLDDSHLLPIEPLFRIVATWRARQDVLQGEASWAIEETPYASGGLPQRTVRALLGYAREPSWRRLRWVTSLGYEHSRVAGGGQSASDVHAIRLQGRVYLTVARGWRVLADGAVTMGLASLAEPNVCGVNGDEPCADRGLHFTLMTGIAYLFGDDARDERLITDVW